MPIYDEITRVMDTSNRPNPYNQGLDLYLRTGQEPPVVGTNRAVGKYSGNLLSEYPASGAAEFSDIDPVLFATGVGATMQGLRSGNVLKNLGKALLDETTGGGTNIARSGLKRANSIGNLIEAGQRMTFNNALGGSSPLTELTF